MLVLCYNGIDGATDLYILTYAMMDAKPRTCSIFTVDQMLCYIGGVRCALNWDSDVTGHRQDAEDGLVGCCRRCELRYASLLISRKPLDISKMLLSQGIHCETTSSNLTGSLLGAQGMRPTPKLCPSQSWCQGTTNRNHCRTDSLE